MEKEKIKFAKCTGKNNDGPYYRCTRHEENGKVVIFAFDSRLVLTADDDKLKNIIVTSYEEAKKNNELFKNSKKVEYFTYKVDGKIDDNEGRFVLEKKPPFWTSFDCEGEKAFKEEISSSTDL